MDHYECWTHQHGDNFLVRLDEDNLITGVCGPLRRSDIPTVNMPNFDFDSQPLHADWIRLHANEFTIGKDTPLFADELAGRDPSHG